MSCQRKGFLLSLPYRFIAGGSLLRRRFPSYAPQDISKCFVFSFNLFVLFFQTATKLLGQIVVKLFWPNCLIDGSAGYLYWLSGTVTKFAEAPWQPWTEKVWERLLYVIPVGREAVWVSEPTSAQQWQEDPPPQHHHHPRLKSNPDSWNLQSVDYFFYIWSDLFSLHVADFSW
jgi:hypothetical protein